MVCIKMFNEYEVTDVLKNIAISYINNKYVSLYRPNTPNVVLEIVELNCEDPYSLSSCSGIWIKVFPSPDSDLYEDYEENGKKIKFVFTIEVDYYENGEIIRSEGKDILVFENEDPIEEIVNSINDYISP